MDTPQIELLDHLAIEVKDPDQALDFYKRIIGLRELDAPAVALEKGIRWLELPEGRMLHLVQNSNAVSARVGHFALRVKDVEEWKKYFQVQGISEEEATVKIYGIVERIFVRDPSGNRIEFLKWSK